MKNKNIMAYRLRQKTIFVSITGALKGLITDTDPITTALPEIARGCWKVDTNKANQCELLAAVIADTIVGVWEIDRNVQWQKMTPNWSSSRKNIVVDPRRKFCELLLNKGVVNKSLVGMRVTSVAGMSSMPGPIQYNF